MSEDICEIPRWQQVKSQLNNLELEDFIAHARDHGGVILDVRTAAEFEQYHLDDAVNLDYLSQTLADELETLDTEQCYYVYCRTGRRALRVCLLLQNLGITRVYNLANGLLHYELA